jgi:hypothetical protein
MRRRRRCTRRFNRVTLASANPIIALLTCIYYTPSLFILRRSFFPSFFNRYAVAKALAKTAPVVDTVRLACVQMRDERVRMVMQKQFGDDAVGGASALVTFIVFSFVLLLRWCECSCDVHLSSLHSAHANLTTINMQPSHTQDISIIEGAANVADGLISHTENDCDFLVVGADAARTYDDALARMLGSVTSEMVKRAVHTHIIVTKNL